MVDSVAGSSPFTGCGASQQVASNKRALFYVRDEPGNGVGGFNHIAQIEFVTPQRESPLPPEPPHEFQV